MLNGVKDLLNAIKGFVLFVLLPIGLLAYYIMNLLSKIKDLQFQVAQDKQKEELQKIEAKESQDEKTSKAAESNYDQLRDEFLRNSAAGTDKKPSGSGGSTPFFGPK